jgi:hypothetical protein
VDPLAAPSVRAEEHNVNDRFRNVSKNYCPVEVAMPMTCQGGSARSVDAMKGE